MQGISLNDDPASTLLPTVASTISPSLNRFKDLNPVGNLAAPAENLSSALGSSVEPSGLTPTAQILHIIQPLYYAVAVHLHDMYDRLAVSNFA